MNSTQCGNFQDFFITDILREINFGDSWSAKSADFAILEAVNFEIWQISALKKSKIHKSQIQSL